MKIKKNGQVIRLTESDLKRIVKRVLSEQGPTPAPKPNFELGELTDPDFMADWNNYTLSTSAKQRRFNEFMKKEMILINNYKKAFSDSGDGSPEDFLSWLGNWFVASGKMDVMLPINWIEYVVNEIELGNYPKSLKDLSKYWNKQNPLIGLKRAIRQISSNREDIDGWN